MSHGFQVDIQELGKGLGGGRRGMVSQKSRQAFLVFSLEKINIMLGGPQASCKNLGINRTKDPVREESVIPCISFLLLL